MFLDYFVFLSAASFCFAITLSHMSCLLLESNVLMF